MIRPLFASGALVAIGCSLFLSAGPAVAVTTPKPPVSDASTAPTAEPGTKASSLRLAVDSYDPVTRIATVTVTGTDFGDRFSVAHRGITDGTTSGNVASTLVNVGADPSPWTGTFKDVYRGDSITLRSDFALVATENITSGPTLPESSVTTRVEGGVVYGTYVHARAGWTHVYDADNHEVAFTAGATHLTDGSYRTDFTLTDTGRTSVFEAEAANAANIRNTVEFVINDGMTSTTVDAPAVGAVEHAGSRAVTTVTGEPGASVTVTDTDGKPVAVKRLGDSGTVQVIVPASATRTANAYSVTQTAGGSTSAAASFTA